MVMGYLVDRIPFKVLLSSIYITWAILAATVVFLVKFKWLYFLAILVNYFCTGGFYAILPPAVNKTFGIVHSPQIYSIILSAGFLSSVTNFLLTEYMLPAVDNNYFVLFMVGMTTQILSFFVLLFYKGDLDVERLRKHGGIQTLEVEVDKNEDFSDIKKEANEMVVGEKVK